MRRVFEMQDSLKCMGDGNQILLHVCMLSHVGRVILHVLHNLLRTSFHMQRLLRYIALDIDAETRNEIAYC